MSARALMRRPLSFQFSNTWSQSCMAVSLGWGESQQYRHCKHCCFKSDAKITLGYFIKTYAECRKDKIWGVFIKLSAVTLTLDLAFVLIQCTLRNRIKEYLTSPSFQCVAHVCIPTTGYLNVFSAPSWKCVQKHLATCVESWRLHTNRSPQIVSPPRWCICRVLVSEHGAAATCAGYQARSST